MKIHFVYNIYKKNTYKIVNIRYRKRQQGFQIYTDSNYKNYFKKFLIHKIYIWNSSN